MARPATPTTRSDRRVRRGRPRARDRRTRTAACVSLPLALLVGAVVTGCDTEPDYVGGPGPTVAVLGDSITELSRDALHAELDPIYRTKVSGLRGVMFAGAQGAAEQYASPAPDRVVIELGTNDANNTTPIADSIAQMGIMVDRFPDSCVVLVTVNDWAANRVGSVYQNDRATAINAAMAQRAADGGRRFVMADYVGTFQDHLAELMSPDLIHPNDAGRTRFAVLVDEALSRCP